MFAATTAQGRSCDRHDIRPIRAFWEALVRWQISQRLKNLKTSQNKFCQKYSCIIRWIVFSTPRWLVCGTVCDSFKISERKILGTINFYAFESEISFFIIGFGRWWYNNSFSIFQSGFCSGWISTSCIRRLNQRSWGYLKSLGWISTGDELGRLEITTSEFSARALGTLTEMSFRWTASNL